MTTPRELIAQHTTQSQMSSFFIDKMGIVNVKSYGAEGDGIADDQPAVQSAASSLTIPGTLFFPATNAYYYINGDLTIPAGVNILSNGATIHVAGFLTLSGDNKIEGLVFDGKWSTKGVKINAAGCKILFNSFENIKSPIVGQTNTINFADGIGDAEIFGNTFDGIKPHAEDAVGGNDEGVSRAIRLAGGNNILIESNVFKNMEGYEDSDYIHAYNPTSTNTTTFPYQAVSGYVYSRVNGVIIRNNIFYHALNKSCVKVQCSGVQVLDNEFIVNYNATGGTTFSVVRSHNNFGTIFKGNKIYNYGTKLVYLVYLEYCEDIIFEDNKIYMENSVSDTTSRIMYVISCKNPVIKNNYIEGYNNKEDVRFDSCKFVHFTGNTIKYKHTDLASRYTINIVKTAVSITNTTFIIKDNVWYSDAALQQSMNFQDISGIIFENNDFVNSPFGGFTFQTASGVLIKENSFGVTSIYFSSMNAGCSNIQIIRNKLGSNVARFINFSAAATGVKAIGNIFDTAPTQDVFSVGASGQLVTELTYLPGSPLLVKCDYGTTAQRPTFNKSIRYVYYDSDLTKLITWDSANWRDGAGTAV